MMRPLLTLFLVLLAHDAGALETLSLHVKNLQAKGWRLEDITIALSGLAANPQQLSLSAAKLQLPKPFDDFTLADIHCPAFGWRNKALWCRQGKAKVRSKRWQSPEARFSFYVREASSVFKLTDLQLAGGRFAVDGKETGDQWQVQIAAKKLDKRFMQKLALPALFELKEGEAAFRLTASGRQAEVQAFKLSAQIDKLTVQTPSGRYATEKMTLSTDLQGQLSRGLWQWQQRSRMTAGALYADPLYLEAGLEDIRLDSHGEWDSIRQRAEIASVNYRHTPAAEINGKATVYLNKGVVPEKAEFTLRSQDLKIFSAVYLKPFLSQTAGEGISLAGDLRADFSVERQLLSVVKASFNKLDIDDEAGRLQMQGGSGTLNWAENEDYMLPSQFGWQQLKLRAIPVGPAQLSFLTKAKSIRLLKKTVLPFLGGDIAIEQFSWQAKEQNDPDVYFQGRLNNASLEQLAAALNWTPLSGTISGFIPRITYRDKTLTLDSKLTVNVFDGSVTISRLSSSGLFTGFPTLKTDLEIDNLDLEQLTGKFKFGSITGKLSGFVRQLHLENWKPVSFYAWLGTPDGDDSRHRISQTAVKNIASIGGGGASDLLSRSFLSFFETFGYDKLGLGCYLHEGVCQMMGVQPAASGYAIITGGGLPRIDVIGYNPRLDWNVLLERLGRISSSEEVIIK